MIPLDDRGLLLGDGLFETMLALDGAIPLIEAHLDRMAGGCATLGLPALDRDAARALCVEAAPPAGRAAVRLTLTAGSGGRGLDRPDPVAPRLLATAAVSPPVQTPAALIVAAARRNEGSPASRLKTLSYLDNVLARAEAWAAGADEAVMLNNRGELACAGAANLFWIEGERVFTPALSCGVLAGITRGRLLGMITVAEVAADAARLDAADAVFLTNSLIGVRPVSRLGQRTFAPHALVTRLARDVV
ncbi:aminotransferase class IV [Caulobacter sp.]|uniref:aminotransferase class IV n=1 Tax=Caulobacter sp. TaxID=78 RepID=UPI003BABF743